MDPRKLRPIFIGCAGRGRRAKEIPHALSALVLLLLCAARGTAQLAVEWSTIDGGGAMFSTGGTFSLGGTIGQPDPQSPAVMSGGSYELAGGFWPVANTCYCLGDMTGDGVKDGRDAQKFIACVLAALGGCGCADVDGIGGVNFNDVTAFVDDLLAGELCP